MEFGIRAILFSRHAPRAGSPMGPRCNRETSCTRTRSFSCRYRNGRKDDAHVEIFQSVTVSSVTQRGGARGCSAAPADDSSSSRAGARVPRCDDYQSESRCAFVSLVLNKKKHAPCLINALSPRHTSGFNPQIELYRRSAHGHYLSLSLSSVCLSFCPPSLCRS